MRCVSVARNLLMGEVLFWDEWAKILISGSTKGNEKAPIHVNSLRRSYPILGSFLQIADGLFVCMCRGSLNRFVILNMACGMGFGCVISIKALLFNLIHFERKSIFGQCPYILK